MNDEEKNENKNKDYIINLRVSRATYEKIKEKAKENRESISSLVRKTVDDSIEIISDLSDELLGREKKGKFKDVVSYHKVKTARQLDCDQCGAVIGIGEIATAGETTGAKKYFFCQNCR
jgi:formamidopyrimidine-DNA glycosylase